MRANPPAPLIAPNNTYRFVVSRQRPGVDSTIYQNVFDYVSTTAGFPTTDIGTLTDSFVTTVVNQMKPIMGVGALVVNVRGICTSLTTVADEIRVITVNGTDGGSPLNNMLTAVLTRYSGLKGQHGRGRTCWGPLTDTLVSTGDVNQLSARGKVALKAFAAACLTSIGSVGTIANPCVTTRPAQGQFVVTRAVALDNIIVQVVCGTIRRRREGRGI